VEGFDARQTYDAASHDYEEASREVWQYLSRRTVDRLGLDAGECVLDIACGTGPGVVEAARLVGEDGLVVGVDYAEQMLALAREKVDGLPHVDLRVADAEVRARCDRFAEDNGVGELVLQAHYALARKPG
jgi:ubiquinone/menaquinone biosynthesis C-methylase UbiE